MTPCTKGLGTSICLEQKHTCFKQINEQQETKVSYITLFFSLLTGRIKPGIIDHFFKTLESDPPPLGETPGLASSVVIPFTSQAYLYSGT